MPQEIERDAEGFMHYRDPHETLRPVGYGLGVKRDAEGRMAYYWMDEKGTICSTSA